MWEFNAFFRSLQSLIIGNFSEFLWWWLNISSPRQVYLFCSRAVSKYLCKFFAGNWTSFQITISVIKYYFICFQYHIPLCYILLSNISIFSECGYVLEMLFCSNGFVETDSFCFLQENSEWNEWQASILLERNAVENVYRWACGYTFASHL